MTEQDKIIAWMESAFTAITEAHGNPTSVLKLMPAELKKLLISNNIHLVYKGEKDV